jgi:hypothetical protein
VARVIRRGVKKGYIRVKLIPEEGCQSALMKRADKNGYVVMSDDEFTELLDPLFARTR